MTSRSCSTTTGCVARYLCTGLLLPWILGCPSSPTKPGFLTKQQAIRIVEANRAAISGGLKARGSARGSFRDPDGKVRSFDLIGKLLVAPPDHLRFTLESVFGGDELEVGMNTAKWWTVTQRPRSVYREGPRGYVDIVGVDIPISPVQLIESLGLNAFESSIAAPRVVDDHQQLIFFDGDRDGNVIIAKEYWIDRRPPNLIRRIQYRDTEGRVVFESRLDGYRELRPGGPQLPRVLEFSWPQGDAIMRLTVDRWEERDTISPTFRGFVSPYDRGAAFDVVDLMPERTARD